MATATLIEGTIEVIGREKNGQYGPYKPVLFKLADGSEIWKSYKPDAPELAQLRKGQTYQLVKVGDEIKLVAPGQSTPQAQATTPPIAPAHQTDPYRMGDDQKRDVAAYVSQMGDLLAYCRNVAQQKLGDVEEETIRTSTASLFITAQRKFNL
ncbi:hypothetical protein NDI45_12795 [Leptolyngbya sp. GB1-A1]|uniref:hypothetical protein n=1 Tax=Leptolyngbya sp. GB1-A1 TaxID=2933908 RepID=UPI00329A2CE7